MEHTDKDCDHPSYEGLCCVAPSPDLVQRMQEQLASAPGGEAAPMRSMLQYRFPVRYGMDDGVIYPAHVMGLGTPDAVIRGAAPQRAPTGVQRVIVVLASFSDKPLTTDMDHYQRLFFGDRYSVKAYYNEVSNGAVTIAGEIVGPVVLPRTEAEYANGQSGTGGSSPNAATMAYDAAVLANPLVNFAQYDNNNDGYVDAYIVIHAGRGAEETGNASEIWSHKWVLANGAYPADGSNVYAYLTIPEDAKLGVSVHELGHLLFGLPDLYDTDYSTHGVGNWCVMGGGSWANRGDTPVHPSAWCKAQQGWVQIDTPGSGTTTLAEVKETKRIIRVNATNVDNDPEYFLLEVRTRSESDKYLPGEGLLIWHIDDSIDSNRDETHPKVKLMQADGRDDLRTRRNQGDEGDPYPGTTQNMLFDATSNPNSKPYGGGAGEVGASIRIISVGPPYELEIGGGGNDLVPLYRYYNGKAVDHFYTTDFNELGNGRGGYALEQIQCYVHPKPGKDTVPLFRYYNKSGTDHFYTTDWNELGEGKSGWKLEKTECHVHAKPLPGTVPLYRYYNGKGIDHFYTTNYAELRKGGGGWNFENVQCYVYPGPGGKTSSGVPVASIAPVDAPQASFELA